MVRAYYVRMSRLPRMDHIMQFLETCIDGPSAYIEKEEMYRSYLRYCKSENIEVQLGPKNFIVYMRQNGYEPTNNTKRAIYIGICPTRDFLPENFDGQLPSEGIQHRIRETTTSVFEECDKLIAELTISGHKPTKFYEENNIVGRKVLKNLRGEAFVCSQCKQCREQALILLRKNRIYWYGGPMFEKPCAHRSIEFSTFEYSHQFALVTEFVNTRMIKNGRARIPLSVVYAHYVSWMQAEERKNSITLKFPTFAKCLHRMRVPSSRTSAHRHILGLDVLDHDAENNTNKLLSLNIDIDWYAQH